MAEQNEGGKAEQKSAEPVKKVDTEKEAAEAGSEHEQKPEAPQPQAAPVEPASPQPAPAEPPKAEEKKPAQAASKIERPANCVVCNKSIKLRKRWYYRNGKYYCTKRCWMTSVKKKGHAPQSAQESGQS